MHAKTTGMQQRTAVVTGAGTGIGLATCELLAAEGFLVFACVLTQEEAKAVQAAVPADQLQILIFDVTDEVAVHRAAAQVRSTLKGHRLTGLVNNAGKGSAYQAPCHPSHRSSSESNWK